MTQTAAATVESKKSGLVSAIGRWFRGVFGSSDGGQAAVATASSRPTQGELTAQFIIAPGGFQIRLPSDSDVPDSLGELLPEVRRGTQCDSPAAASGDGFTSRNPGFQSHGRQRRRRRVARLGSVGLFAANGQWSGKRALAESLERLRSRQLSRFWRRQVAGSSPAPGGRASLWPWRGKRSRRQRGKGIVGSFPGRFVHRRRAGGNGRRRRSRICFDCRVAA